MKQTYYSLYNAICAILIALCFIGIYSLYTDILSVFAFNAVAQAIIISNYILCARSFSLKADYYSWIKLLLYEVIVILYNQLLKTNTSILLCVFSISNNCSHVYFYCQ